MSRVLLYAAVFGAIIWSLAQIACWAVGTVLP